MFNAIRGYPLRAFLICLVCLTFANLDHSLFAFVLTEISAEYGWSLVERGWFIALTFLVAAVIIMVSIGEGSKQQALDRIERLEFGGAKAGFTCVSFSTIGFGHLQSV